MVDRDLLQGSASQGHAEQRASPLPANGRRTGAGAAGALGAAALVLALLVIVYAERPTALFEDDFQIQHLPATRDVAHALAHGEAPLLSPSNWAGGALLAEYQPGVASLFATLASLLVWMLRPSPLHAAVLLAALHEAVLAAGSYRLARRRAGAPAALMVAVVAALNGYLLRWAASDWYPALVSFAWLPWYWSELEALLAGDHRARRWVGAGVCLYLVLAGGFPHTVAMAAAVTLAVALRARARADAPLAAWRSMLLALALGGALAAPALLPLLEWYRASTRATTALEGPLGWRVPLGAWPALVLPGDSTAWDEWDPAAPGEVRPGLDLAGGLVPLAAVVAALALARRELVRRAASELGLVVASAILASLPGIGALRWSFRWLPLFQLALALAGAVALEILGPTARRARAPAIAGLALVAAAWAADARPHPWSAQAHWLLAITLLALLGWWLAAPRAGARAAVAVTGALFVATWSLFLPRPEVPRWPVDDARSLTPRLPPGRRFLAVATVDDIMPGARPRDRAGANGVRLRAGNLAELTGETLVNGYSPFGHPGLRALGGYSSRGDMQPAAADRLLARELDAAGWPAYAGVDGLLLPAWRRDRVAALAALGWQLFRDDGGVIVLLRTPPPHVRTLPWLRVAGDANTVLATLAARPAGEPPLVAPAAGGLPVGLHRFAPAAVEVVEDARNRTRVRVRVAPGPSPALVLVARCWYPGLRAWLAGRERPVERVAGFLPAVQVPGGTDAELVLAYRPRSLELGLLIAALGILGATVALLRERRPARRC